MPGTEAITQRFELRPAALRRLRRTYLVALAWYLPSGLILTGAAAWSAGQPAAAIAGGRILGPSPRC